MLKLSVAVHLSLAEILVSTVSMIFDITTATAFSSDNFDMQVQPSVGSKMAVLMTSYDAITDKNCASSGISNQRKIILVSQLVRPRVKFNSACERSHGTEALKAVSCSTSLFKRKTNSNQRITSTQSNCLTVHTFHSAQHLLLVVACYFNAYLDL